MSSSWYETGFDGINKEEERLSSRWGIPRFWLPAGNTKDWVAVDDDFFNVHEHNPKLNGSWKNWMTCLRGVYDDVVCCEKLGGTTRYYVGHITIVNCSSWQDKRGVKHEFELELLSAKLGSLKTLKRKKSEREGLVGKMFKSARDNNDSAGIGGEFEFQREVDLVKMFEVTMYKGKKLSAWYDDAEKSEESMKKLQDLFQVKLDDDGKLIREVVPFNYFEQLKPMPPAAAKDMLFGFKATDQDNKSDGGKSGADESIPF